MPGGGAARCRVILSPHTRVNKEAAPMSFAYFRLALAAALLGTGLSGCIIAPEPAYEGDVVYEAPPAVRYEAVGVAPSPGYFWIGGNWFWDGGHYGWRGGHWEAPRQGYRWHQDRWHRVGKGWRHEPGRWDRR
jgi:hypothetical protein